MGTMYVPKMAESDAVLKVQEMQAQFQSAISREAPSATLSSLLGVAHKQVESLQQEIERLGNILNPVRSAVPCGVGQGASPDLNGEPELIGILRALIDRLASQQAKVRNICEEVRI